MKPGFIIAIGLAIAGIFLARRANAATAYDPDSFSYGPENDVNPARDDPSYWFISSGVESMDKIANIQTGTEDERIFAFLAMIRQFESNDDYNVIYGGSRFSDMTDHPRKRIPINIPGYEGKFSSAAGAYQFIEKTWDNLATRLGLTDFSPASQDSAAIELLREIGALPYIKSGNFDQAVRIAASQWASLPYSAAKQNPKSIVAANEFLNRYMSA